MTYLLRYVIERFMNVYQAVFLLFIWSFQEASFLQISQITQMHRLTIIIFFLASGEQLLISAPKFCIFALSLKHNGLQKQKICNQCLTKLFF